MKQPTSYWNNKLLAYLHDPPEKVFCIQKHEAHAQKILNLFSLENPNKQFWKLADQIASGLDRGQVPSYNSDPNQNGAINFGDQGVITHPVSAQSLEIDLKDLKERFPDNKKLAAYLNQELLKFLEKEIKDETEDDPKKIAIKRFLSLHLMSRFKLAAQNIGEIGGLWHRLPADSRFPDHSIWHHNQLVSAINSCFEIGKGDQSDLGLMVLSITPVQQFIGKARKLRDLWTGSVLLSWLAFEGIKWVLENLGPDHILYPSLVDQPLINEYLKKTWDMELPESLSNQAKGIASFPNKFVALIPVSKSQEIGKKIREHILTEWKKLAEIIHQGLSHKLKLSNQEQEYVKTLFERETSSFWDIQWSTAQLLTTKNKDEIKKLLDPSLYETQFDALDIFNQMKDEDSGIGKYYSISHTLAQSGLAAQKGIKKITREPEPGEKCQMCGEFEVLHSSPLNSKSAAHEYKKGIQTFWLKVQKTFSESQINKHERLCAICTMKRLAYYFIKQDKNHILNTIFSENDQNYPTTTEMALDHYFHRHKISNQKSEQKEIIEKLYESKTDELKLKNKIEDFDKYYAILMMDGDKMGDLINGQTLTANWENILHPEMVKRLWDPKFCPEEEFSWHKTWSKLLNNKRILAPSTHAAISEALGDFAIYGVSNIVEKYSGKLIYAGGDDVCAVLPVSKALPAAKEIKDYYTSHFRYIEDNENAELKKSWRPKKGKLSLNLGVMKKGKETVSISAGILICHHKEHMGHMIQAAHHLLDQKAKTEGNRNACAIELRKRSGGSRYMLQKWDHEGWEALEKVTTNTTYKISQELSTSLIYRLDEFKIGIEEIFKCSLNESEKEILLKEFFAFQLKRSGLTSNENIPELSKIIYDLVIRIEIIKNKEDKEKKEEIKFHFNTEPLIIASFLSQFSQEAR